MVIYLNSDKSVKKIKGSKRPIENEKKRKLKLIKLKHVSDVLIFSETTPLKLIKRLNQIIFLKDQITKIRKFREKIISKNTEGKLF